MPLAFPDSWRPEILWGFVVAIFGTAQIWTNISMQGRLFRQYPGDPAAPVGFVAKTQYILGDGNLFAFSIATTGGVIAIIAKDLLYTHGKFFVLLNPSIQLLLEAGAILVWSVFIWTVSRSTTLQQIMSLGATPTIPLPLLLGWKDIGYSIMSAIAAFAVALMAEALPHP